MYDMISMIVPVYNASSYLHFCLDSILIQEDDALEILLIDDGSSDKSGEICDHYAEMDSRIQVIHKKNEGVSEARNTGIEHAKGRYLVFVDSDDYIAEDYIKQARLILEKKRKDVFLWWSYETVSGYRRKKNNVMVTDLEDDFQIYTREDVLHLYHECLLNSIWNKLYEKSILVENGIRMRKDLSLGEDLLFNLEYLKYNSNKKIIVLKKTLYYYVRTGKESLSNKYYSDEFENARYLNMEVRRYCISWNVKEQWGEFYDCYFWMLNSALYNYYQYKKRTDFWKAVRENERLMHTEEYQRCRAERSGHYFRLREMAYEKGFYLPVLFFDRIGRWKRRLVGEKR